MSRPREYLRLDEWEKFLNNHWRHMTWKVNGLVGGMAVIVGFLVAILCAMLAMIYGG